MTLGIYLVLIFKYSFQPSGQTLEVSSEYLIGNNTSHNDFNDSLMSA